MTEFKIRAQCLIHRGDKILMTRLINKRRGMDLWMMPGGGVEPGEHPAQAALRELKEECCVDGTLIEELRIEQAPSANRNYDWYYTFLVDIGDQEPKLGIDPDDPNPASPMLADLQWLSLKEMPERDRAWLISSGLLLLDEFLKEVMGWGNEISYPGK